MDSLTSPPATYVLILFTAARRGYGLPMPFDPTPDPADSLPAWLHPATIDSIARMVERAPAGASDTMLRRLATDYAWALHPGMPAAEISEAVALALWAARR